MQIIPLEMPTLYTKPEGAKPANGSSAYPVGACQRRRKQGTGPVCISTGPHKTSMASHVPGSGVRMIHPLETARMQTRTIAPKPLHRPAKLPARKPNRMTIAIGMLCEGGLAIAADTQATNADGTTYDRAKVKVQKTAKGLFAAAFSGEDLNATEMLINDFLIDLNLLDPQSIFGVEDAIRNRMLQWSAIFQAKDERLYTGFVLGARVAGNSVNPSKLALYFCEPPG